MSEAHFRALVSRLRREVPTLLPVRVHIRDDLEDWGQADLRRKGGKPSHFIVDIRRAVLPIMRDTLFHEWAHCLAWHEGEFFEHHGPEWGLAMSRVWQTMVGP